MTDHAEFIRDSMRRNWGRRTESYTAFAAPHTAAYTSYLLELVAPGAGERVLDVATGPGVVAVAAARAVGPAGAVVATDLAPEWDAVVAERAARAGGANVTFGAMGAEALELPDASFDLALCQFGLMFVPDPVRALREMRRVLRDGGRLGLVVWSTVERAAFVSLSQRVMAAYLPPPPAGARFPGPLELGEPGMLERHVADAGFQEIVVTARTLEYVLDDPEEMWRGQVLNGSSGAAVAALDDATRERAHAGVIAALERYRHDGRIYLPSEAIYVTARR